MSVETGLRRLAYRTLGDGWVQKGQPQSDYVITLDGEPMDSLKDSYHAALAGAGIQPIDARPRRQLTLSSTHVWDIARRCPVSTQRRS
jgi:hypothetical protein